MGRRPLIFPYGRSRRWQTTQVIPSREVDERSRFDMNSGSSRFIPTGVWHRMQKSPFVKVVCFRMVACIALNTVLICAYACDDTDHSR